METVQQFEKETKKCITTNLQKSQLMHIFYFAKVIKSENYKNFLAYYHGRREMALLDKIKLITPTEKNL